MPARRPAEQPEGEDAAPPGARLERSHTGPPPEDPETADGATGPPRRSGALAKRGLDIVLAAAQILLSAPLWVLLSVAIKLEDGGPVFYGQERVGQDGRLFRSWKFRSMTPRRADADGPPKQAGLEEHRVTRVGRLMRATALDELPQLWNILVGDMSYVGPRALLPEEEEREGEGEPVKLRDLPGYEERHSLRPGLTGLAQVRLRRNVPHRVKFRHDLEYVRRRTLWLDVKLIAVSIWISVRGKWPEVGHET